MSRPWAVESSAMAVSLLAGPLGERPAPQRRQELVAEIQGWQDPQTGLFQDPLITVKDHVENAVHTWEHIWNHHTGVCAEALETLGVAPLHALPGSVFGLDAESLTEDSIGQWVLGLAWENPWLAGEHFSRGVAALHRAGGSKAAVVERAFDVLAAEILNPATGCPDRRNQSGAHNAMAGLFKVMFGYRATGRQVPHAERGIDSTLALQDREGGMGQDNLCIHWDAAWVLKNLNAQLKGGYRLADIREASRRLAAFLMKAHRKPDGGFSFHRGHCVTVHDSIRVSKALPESDIMGTLMSCECLGYAAEWEQGISRPVER
jgi:hypothetical protein